MSMKFLSGLQDLLGLYDSSAAPNSPQSPSTPIPPTSPSLYSSGIGRTQKKTIQEINCNQAEDVQIRRCSHEKTVHFAENLITGYSEPPHSPFPDFVDEENIGARHGPNPEEILASYKRACEMTNVVPNPQVVKQIGYMHRTLGVRQELLSLKGERVSYADMEALEAVFKMVQFEMIDLEYTFLEDDALVSLAEMLEYYDSTLKLNLSFNRNVTGRGWAALFRVLRIRARLVFLNLRYTTIDCSFTIFCRILRTQPNPVLTCLHLENVSLSGKNLTLLSSALKSNTVLRELFLGENNLQPSDGEYIYQMIIGNTSLQMLDLRNNELADYGLNHICEALKNKNTMAQSALTALVMWNNRITHDSMQNLALALIENHHLETLNIGSNELGLEGISKLKYALAGNSNLHRLGLQQTSLNCQAAIVMAECLADNNTMIRVDLRENPNIGSAGLLALHSAMKMNTAITNLNLDEGCIVPSSEKVPEYQEEFSRYFGEIREFCERNKKAALERMAVRTTNDDKHVDEVKSSDEHTSSDNETTKSDDSEKKSDERAVVKKTRGNRFCRSASLTCQETITDIPERIRQMSGSTHSLDEATHPESVSTIKNKSTAQSTLGKVEWGSLPAIPQAVKQEKEEKVVTTSTPVVRKMRRFSVSPTSSTFSINSEIKTSSPLTVPRPHCLSISIPEHDLTPQMSGPMSAPTSSSLPLITSFQNSTKVKETVHEEPEPIVVSTTSGDEKEFTATLDVLKITEDEKLERERKSPVRETEEDQETSVRLVVSDLVSYVVYEETQEQERKASLLLGSHPDPKILRMMLVEDCGSTPGTPSRIQNIAEELSEDESDDLVVQSVVRGLVRDVLKSEKEALRQVLELRRKQRSLQSTSGSS